MLPWGAGILAPEAFHVYRAQVTTSSLATEHSIDLHVVPNLAGVVIDITTAGFAVPFETLGHSLDNMRLGIHFFGLPVV